MTKPIIHDFHMTELLPMKKTLVGAVLFLEFTTPAAAGEKDDCFASPTTECVLALANKDALRERNLFIRMHVFSSIGTLQASLRKTPAARKAFTISIEATSGDPNLFRRARSLATIAALMYDAGEVVAAKAALASALAEFKKAKSGSRVNAYLLSFTLTRIAQAQARILGVTSALKTSKQITSPRFRTQAVIGIALVEARAGRLASAKSVLATAYKLAREQTGRALDGDLIDLAQAHAKLGDIDQARAFAERIKPKKDRRYSRSRALRAVAMAEIRANRAEAALVTVKGIKADWIRRNLAAEAAIAQAKVGNLTRALATIASMRNPALPANATTSAKRGQAFAGIWMARKKVWALTRIAIVELDRKNNNGAKQALSLAQAIAASLDGNKEMTASHTVHIYADLAEVLARLGDTKQAKDLFAKAVAPASKLRFRIEHYGDTRTPALRYIARAQLSAGYVGDALRTTQRIASPAKDYPIFAKRAGGYGGYMEIAKRLAGGKR